MNNPRTYGEVLWRPVDRRENYVKRCVGLPGDTLQIVDGQVMIDGKAIENPENLQFNYFVQTTGPYIPEDMLRELGISKDDTMLIEDSRLGKRIAGNGTGQPECTRQTESGISFPANQEDV